MSILLSAYFAEGIVFAADKNLTYRDGDTTYVEEGTATKVIPWAHRRAVVGFCGKAILAGIPMEEWLRQFAAETREFDDISELAKLLHARIQQDFQSEYPENADIDNDWLIVHLGGFRYEKGIPVPAMYFIRNVPGFDENTGKYHSPNRDFLDLTDELEALAEKKAVRTPERFRPWLRENYEDGKYLWFNNGTGFGAFNLFKASLWNVLKAIRSASNEQIQPSLQDHRAFCAMSVELFNSFFRHHAPQNNRFVGGGVDIEWVPWPEVSESS